MTRLNVFTTGESTAHAEFLQSIHDPDDIYLPITLVRAGLGDMYARLRSRGLTQAVTTHPLGCFNTEELNTLSGK
ncbi:MAG: hypothetical protein OXC68_05155 [Aestuariivita sp.]|nr:hypothetical protein [Aestuariivita sp.]